MFNKISNIKYDINTKGKMTDVKNIFRFAYILDSYKDNPKNYIQHTIENNQTVEMIADKYYGSSSYSWVIMMYNNLLDIYEEFPKTQNVLRDFIGQKYQPKNVIEAKRILPLPPLSLGGETVVGKYDGQIIYDESSDRGLIWKDTVATPFWDVLPGFGVPDPSPRTFEITCNNLDSPEKSTHWLLDGKEDPDLFLIRGGVYTFKIQYAPDNNFYMTTDDGGNWKRVEYFGSYIENQKEVNTLNGKTITFTIPKDAPDTLYYMSQNTAPYPLYTDEEIIAITGDPKSQYDTIAEQNKIENAYNRFSGLLNVRSSLKQMTGMIRIRNQEDVAYVIGSDKNSLQTQNGRVMGKVAKIENSYYVWNGNYFPANSVNYTKGWNLLNPESTTEESYTMSLGILVAMNTPHKFIHTSDETEISIATYSLMQDDEKVKYYMQTKYDYEEEKNEKNRTIRIMKQELLGEFLKHWEKVIA